MPPDDGDCVRCSDVMESVGDFPAFLLADVGGTGSEVAIRHQKDKHGGGWSRK